MWRLDLYDHAHANLHTRLVDPSDDCLVLHDEPDARPMNWDAFLDYLAGLPTDEWCDLYLEQVIPRDEAMQLGVRIADHAARVWHDLAPLYLACTDPSDRGKL